MEPSNKTKITVKVTVNAPLHKVWNLWTMPEHICKWNNASDDWHTPKAENDLRVGGKFMCLMEAKDGSFGFEFSGVYTTVEINKTINYTLDDGRMVWINFAERDKVCYILESFEAETENAVQLQEAGWQAILTNFKKYAEANLA